MNRRMPRPKPRQTVKMQEIAAEAGETGGSYTDGIYQGTATGFGGDIQWK